MPQTVTSPPAIPGETYFFRDPAIFSAIATHIFPALLRERRGRDEPLRLWSAGCASGEEACSLAIVVRQSVPAAPGREASILATDNNRSLLEKAEAGVYGEWSFRGGPSRIKDLYFARVADHRYAIRPDLRALVTYQAHDLRYDVYPGGPAGFDVIVCRHVLMYLAPAQRQMVVRNLHQALAPGGWLIVSPAETSQEIFRDLETVVIDGRTFYRRSDGIVAPGRAELPAPHELPAPVTVSHTRPAQAPAAPSPSASARVRRLAGEGSFADALAECDRWIRAEKLDPTAHYLQAIVLAEVGRIADARRALQRAVYLDPSFVLAHFTLGTLARAAGHEATARRHFGHTQRLLNRLDPRELLPESDGIPAGRLSAMLAELTRDV